MKWIKDNGDAIETNNETETVKACEALGWKKGGDQSKTKVVKKEKTDKK